MRLGRWHRRIVLMTLGLAAASGVLWFFMHDVMGRAPDPLLHAILIVHGVMSFGAGIALGSLLPWHVLGGILWRRSLFSGLGTALAMVVLIVSALLLYYGGEEMHEWARAVHVAAGFALIAVIIGHAVAGRRLRLADCPYRKRHPGWHGERDRLG